MKRIVSQTIILLLSLVAACFVSCEKPEPQEEPQNTPVTPVVHGVYVLSEGIMNYNNSTLIFYDFDKVPPPTLSLPPTTAVLATRVTT